MYFPQFVFLFVKGILSHFGNELISLLANSLMRKIDTILISDKYKAKASSQLA